MATHKETILTRYETPMKRRTSLPISRRKPDAPDRKKAKNFKTHIFTDRKEPVFRVVVGRKLVKTKVFSPPLCRFIRVVNELLNSGVKVL